MNGEHIGLVEKYLKGELKQIDKEQFEQQLIGNFDLQETLRSYKVLFYSENRLSKSEKEIFEKELRTDHILNEEVRLQKLANGVVQDQTNLESNLNGWESYKELIKKYPDQTISNTEIETGKVVEINKNHSSKNEPNPLRKWMKIAAVLLGFLTITSIWGANKISVSNEEIAKSGVEDTKLMRTARSFDPKTDTENLESLATKLNIAQVLLDKYQFNEAIPILEAAKKQAESEGSDRLLEIHWALGTAYTGVSDTPKAIPEYEAIISYDKRKKALQQKAQYNLYILKIKDKLGLEK